MRIPMLRGHSEYPSTPGNTSDKLFRHDATLRFPEKKKKKWLPL